MTGYRFANPWALQFLWLLPVIVVLSLVLIRRQRAVLQKSFGKKLFPFLTASVSRVRRRWKFALELLVLFFMIFALARPQSGKSQQKVKSEGVELMIVFDVSNSMMAEDVRPSRMELAKKEISRLLDLGGGDRVGLIAFAGSGILLSPMTNDKAALKMYIDSLSPSAVSSQGTNFKQALKKAQEAFSRGGIEEDDESVVTRAVVVVSDGEDNEPGALEFAKELRKQGVRIFSLGVGTEKGGAIPVRDQRGNLRGYRKDKAGKVVLTRTKGTVLKELARVGDGAFYHMTLGGSVGRKLKEDLGRLQKAEFESAEITNYDEKYQSFLMFAVLLALIELFLGERRSQGRIWKGRFEVAEQ